MLAPRGRKPIRRIARTPPQCCRLTPTKREGKMGGGSKSSLIELLSEAADSADAVGAVTVGVLILRL